MANFGVAIAALKMGRSVTRSGWNGRDMWIALHRSEAGDKMTLPFIYMHTAQRDLVPWLASQTDLLAEDWSIVS